MSRLQYFCFFVLNLGLLLGQRAVLRIYDRLAGQTWPGLAEPDLDRLRR